MDKLDKRTIEIIEKILKLLENTGNDIDWNNKEDDMKESNYFLN